jgi:hypothetical protein
MGWLRKKNDPIKDREKNLASEIEQLEEQIRSLQGVLKAAEKEPRVGRTTLPGGRSAPARSTGGEEAPRHPGASDPVFEPVDQERLQSGNPNPFLEKRDPRALQREGSTGFWERLIRYFRGPTSSNPKLVSYLAAGNIHGLQPLRYERRVARNRLLLWIAIIIVVIVGVLKMSWR